GLRRDALEGLAAVGGGDEVLAQAGGQVLRVAHRGDAPGVDRLHLRDQVEHVVELGAGGLELGGRQFDAGEAGDMADLFTGQRHGLTKPAESTKVCRLSYPTLFPFGTG